MYRKILSILIALLIMLSFSVINAYAQTYDVESENNDTIANADNITSERIMRGKFSDTSDNYDYY